MADKSDKKSAKKAARQEKELTKAAKKQAHGAKKADHKAKKKAEKEARAVAHKAAHKAADKATQKAAHKATKTPKPKKQKKVDPVPKGMHTVTPGLVFLDSRAAIEFYEQAFGARTMSVMPGPDGKAVWHAEIQIGDSVIYLNDWSEMSYTALSSPEHRATATMWLYVKDVDAWFERAVAAGCKATMPVTDMFWGDRMGGVVDPYGILWMMAMRTQKLSPREMQAAQDEFVRRTMQSPPQAAPLAEDKAGGKPEGKAEEKKGGAAEETSPGEAMGGEAAE